MPFDDESIVELTYTTGSPSFREGEFTLILRSNGDVHLVHREFIHQREWIARLAANVWDEVLTKFNASSLRSATNLVHTFVPGTLVSRVAWKSGETQASAVIGTTSGELEFKKLTHQLVAQVAPGLMELGPWRTDRKLIVNSHEVAK